jgi:uncharacterized membrane protein
MLFFLVAIALFVGLDYLWFKLTGSIYKNVIHDIQSEPVKVNYISASLLYILLAIFLYVFVIDSFTDRTTYVDSISAGFLVGVSLFLFVNLVTSSTFSKYTFNLVAIDSLWGGISFAIVSTIMLALGAYQ